MSYNPFTLAGRTIMITGASSGIGRATAIECSKLGANCIITGRNSERLQETFAMLEGSCHQQIPADIVQEEDIDRITSESPVIDGLVNNVGIQHTKPFGFISKKDLDQVFAANTFGPILLTKGLLKKKKINKGGSIVFTSSIAGLDSLAPANSVYGASKAAITSFTKYAALEYADKMIRVNAIHPGMVETPLIHNTAISEEDMKKDMLNYPLKRYGRPEEIAWYIIFLLSDAAAWITGTQPIIDGGIHLK